MSRLHRSISTLAVAVIGGSSLTALTAGAGAALAGEHMGGSAAATTHLLSCSRKPLTRPSGDVIIACGDGNFAIDDTQWSSWTARSATGTSDLQINLCNPNCAASKMVTFKDSPVRLFDARHVARYGEVFTKISVTYRHDGRNFTVIGYPTT